MADVTVKRIDEFDTAFGGAMKLVRHGLGVESFGIQVIDMPPNADRYPEHDHAEDGQEEVYGVLQGAATLQAGGEEPARLLALGGVPGNVYEIPPQTNPAQSS